jgi:hypothetical protein
MEQLLKLGRGVGTVRRFAAAGFGDYSSPQARRRAQRAGGAFPLAEHHDVNEYEIIDNNRRSLPGDAT